MPLQAPQFIEWSKPLAQAVASSLLTDTSGAPIDLGSHRVIVPSSFASRLIQEHLAKQAPNGVLLPEFQTPDKFLNWGDRAEEAQRLGGSVDQREAALGLVDFQPLLAYTYEASQHAFDFATFLA